MKTAFSTNGEWKFKPPWIREKRIGWHQKPDPLFFLHHAQLDRIWCIWQSRDPATRQRGYGGKTNFGQAASVKEIVSTFGIRNDLVVSDVLNTRAGPFCYGYSTVFWVKTAVDLRYFVLYSCEYIFISLKCTNKPYNALGKKVYIPRRTNSYNWIIRSELLYRDLEYAHQVDYLNSKYLLMQSAHPAGVIMLARIRT
jgi:hypothetical protein